MPPEPPAPPAAPAVVLFDLDGTLADTFLDLKWALDRALEEHGLAAGNEAAVRDQVSAGARAMTGAALPADHADVESVRQRFLDLYLDNIAVRTRLFDGMSSALARIARAGCAMGIVTNKRGAFTEPLVRHLDLRPAPVCVVSGDSAPRAKPHPDPLIMAARLAGVAPGDCVYVGDARNDVLAARAAGMRVAAVRWGYIPRHEDPADWQADVVLRSPHELPGWLGLAP